MTQKDIDRIDRKTMDLLQQNVLIVMAQVSFKGHTLSDFGSFDDCIAGLPEIVESCRVSGLYD